MIKKNKYFLSNSKEGFTLIELIIVIFIIGLLTTIVVISISGAKSKSRDVKRISEITQLQIALDNYNRVEGRYPESLIPGEVLVGSSTGITFMSKVPINSSYYDVDCYAEGYDYSYDIVKNEYEIAFCLEKKVDNYSSGPKCAIPGKIFDSSCGEGTSSCGGQVADSQGNLYNTVLIGDQCWFQENLRTSEYSNGTDIPNLLNNLEWENATSGAYAWYKNDKATYEPYGALYNWYAVSATTNGGKNLCPDGWHVPTDDEYTSLIAWLISEDGGGVIEGEEGDALKASSSTSPIFWNGNNSSGFTVLPAGFRNHYGNFDGLGYYTSLWSSSESSFGYPWYRYLESSFPVASRNYAYQSNGHSVRCLRD